MHTTKPCNKCGAEKPLVEFQKDPKMRDGHKQECNACRAERVRAQRAKAPERHILVLMVQRCHNPHHHRFALYGGRGITVCDEWRGEGGFARFLTHIGPRPSPKHSIDRIDNSRGYEPGNVRWATQSEQMRNTRRTVRIVAFGRSLTLDEWAAETGTKKRTLEWRRDAGWSAEEIVTGKRRAA